MNTPETTNNPESLRLSAIKKTEALLKDSKAEVPLGSLWSWREGASWVQGLARATFGREYERRGGFFVDQLGFSEVGVIEWGSNKQGKLKPRELIIFGEEIVDGEGRHIKRCWQLDLRRRRYGIRKYELLNKLLDAEEPERSKLFGELTEYEQSDSK
jgi:hypothetical protein